MIVEPKYFRIFSLPNGTEPLSIWLSTINDKVAHKNIIARLSRLSKGHFGDYKRLTPHLYELRIHRRPGYRIYFCKPEPDIIVVLHGGTKKTQQSDIERAQSYLEDLVGDQP